MPTLTADEIYRVCLDAGFSPDQAVTWTAIALAESGGNSDAHNPRGEDSWGLWQVNVDPDVRPNHWGDLSDPAVNARAAFEISNGGTNLRPWTVTHASNQGTNKDYRNFMEEAQAASGGAATGDFSGVTGYHDSSPGSGGGPLPPAPATPATTPAQGTDTDEDGALDAFEMSVGTDPRLPDSDSDGLTDGFERLRGMNARAVDSDADGLSDRRELQLGTDATVADSDHDAMSDGLELAAGRDPLDNLAVVAGDQDQDGLADGIDPDNGSVPAAANPLPAPPGGVPANPLPAGAPAMAMPLVPPPGAPAPMAAAAEPADEVLATQFLDAALGQTGDPYIFGSEAEEGDVDPDAFDCSELTQWAAARVGVELPDGSWLQYLELEERGAVIPVDQALNTPGALLFSFSSEPSAGSGRPSSAHVAISLGDGQTIEARGRAYGVGSWEAGDRFAYAAVIPELSGSAGLAAPATGLPPPGSAATTGPDTDADGVTDLFEMSSGTDPTRADSDNDGLTDGFELMHGADGLVMDTDSDGLSDAYEQRLGTAAGVVDSDQDGLSDALELSVGRDARFGAAPGLTPADGGATVDTDSDGLSDAWENSLGSDARLADSDHDGLTDALELVRQTDPGDPDSDDDGLVDRWDDFDEPDR